MYIQWENNVDGAAEADAEAIHEAERTQRMDQEPWSFGDENTALVKEAIDFQVSATPLFNTLLSGNIPIKVFLFFETYSWKLRVTQRQ